MTGQKSVLSCGNARALLAFLPVAEKACTAELAENVDDRPPCRGPPGTERKSTAEVERCLVKYFFYTAPLS